MWKFRKLGEGELERNPRETEFFNVGDIDKPAALVREIIQNSLDAKLSEKALVHVRFTLGKHQKSDTDIYYKELIDHLKSCGLLSPEYLTGAEIPFLTIEDFGTTGLDGPVTTPDTVGEIKGGNYYNLWWCEGKSQKVGTSAGRWGLGKTAFHVASKLRSFWGLTIRYSDNRELLLGKSLLKTHWHNGSLYDYYGYFADDGYKPIEIKQVLEEFRARFALKRKEGTGLSIVIPMPSAEINFDSIIRSVIIHYFFPIMKGMLTVEVVKEGLTVVLNGSTLCEIAQKQDWRDSPWEDGAVDSLMEFLEDAAMMSGTDIVSLQMPAGTPKIREDLFGDKLNQLRKAFSENALLCIKVPVRIQPKGKPEVDSYFEVYLKKDDTLSRADEFYVRAGITISEIRKLGNRRVRALLSAQDEPVCTFLGDCESPAHTDWKERTEEFQNKYHGAVSTLRFIKSSMADIVRILDQPPPGVERDFLQDVFFIPESIEEQQRPDTLKPPPKIEGVKPQIFNIAQIKGGFSATLSKKGISEGGIGLPVKASLRVAYDTRRGNPFTNYHPMDFQLTSDDFNISLVGGKIIEKSQNCLTVSADDVDFELQVAGFDEHRDLVVDIREATEQ